MKLHVLGAGTPDPRASRYGTAFLLELDDPDNLILLDCGPATTYKMARMGIDPTRVGSLFLSHHHFDHNADVPCFALTRWDQKSNDPSPFPVYGPPPTTEFFGKLFGETDGAYYPDWKARQETPASQILFQGRGGTLPRPAPAFDIHELTDGDTVERDGYTVRAVKVHHVEPWLYSLAYRFEFEQGTVVFSADAGACDALTQLCQGAEVLILCCAYASDSLHPDIAHCVTGPDDCAELASSSGARLVILDHCSQGVDSPGNRERVITRVGADYDGTLILADELTTLNLD